MKKLTLLLLFVTKLSLSQYNFPDLEYINIEESNLGGMFGVKKNSDFKVVNELCEENMACYKYFDPTTLIGVWKLEDKTKIEFHYTEAPSDDPTFIAVLNEKIIFEETGTKLHFKGKQIYIEGKANSYFDKKRKFQFVEGKYQEVTQPFYHIGIQGNLNFPIHIFKTDMFEEKIAYLPKGYNIEVVMGLTGGEYDELEKVLVKTEFGLIGWYNFKEVTFSKPLIDGLNYFGD